MPPSPTERRRRSILPKTTPPKDNSQTVATTLQKSHPALDEHPQSLDGEPRLTDSSSSSIHSPRSSIKEPLPSTEFVLQTRGIWEWARLGRMGIISRKSEPPGFLTTRAATLAMTGALQDSRGLNSSTGSPDDLSLVSATSTFLTNSENSSSALGMRSDGAGISNTSDSYDFGPFFSQTKGSSDDLVAASSTNGTPEAERMRTGDVILEESEPSTTTSPCPQPKSIPAAASVNSSAKNDQMSNKTGKDHVPRYKIALASHIMSPPTRSSASCSESTLF